MADQPESNLMKRFLPAIVLRIGKPKPITWVAGGLILALVGGASGISFFLMKPKLQQKQVEEARRLLDAEAYDEAIKKTHKVLNSNRATKLLTAEAMLLTAEAAFIHGKALYFIAGKKADDATKEDKLVAAGYLQMSYRIEIGRAHV